MTPDIGIGSLIAAGTLAFNVYNSCRAASDIFKHISSEVWSLHAVLKEAEETIFVQPLSPDRQQRLKVIGDGCYCVLKDLKERLEKYPSLGTGKKLTLDRMRWCGEETAMIRARLTSNVMLLIAWVRCDAPL